MQAGADAFEGNRDHRENRASGVIGVTGVLHARPRLMREGALRRAGRIGMTILALFAGLTTVADSAEARRRGHAARHHHHGGGGYSRPAAAMVVDGRTGKVLHTHNIDAPRHPASLTKIMTLHLLFEQLRAGKVTMDTELKVSEKAADQAPSKLELQAGETIAVKDAIKALVTKSANDVAVVVAENLGGSEAAFARAMTEKARSLGMSRTVYKNASGLPNEEQTTTARDQIALAQHTLRRFPEQSKVFQTRFFQYKGHIYRNHNGLLFSYPGTEGMKTGYTQAAGFNLVVTARRGGKHLVAVVLGGQSSFSRNQAMRALLDAAWPSASSSGKVEPLVASAAGPVLASRALPAAPQPAGQVDAAQTDDGEEGENEADGTPELPEPNPAFHSTPEEQRLQAQILAAINGTPAGGGKGSGLPITAVLAGASSDKVEAVPPAQQAEPMAGEMVQAAAEQPSPAAAPADEAEAAPAQAAQNPAQAAQDPAQQAAPAAPARAVPVAGVWSQEPAPKGDLGPIARQAASGPAAVPAAVEQSAAPASNGVAEGEEAAVVEPQARVQVASASPAPASAPQYGPYNVQVGSYDDAAGAQKRLAAVRTAVETVVKGHPGFLATAQISGKDVYRARYGSFSEKEAQSACAAIKKHKFECMVVRAD